MRFRYVLTAVALVMLAAGCDKATDPSTSDKPILAAVVISVPSANVSDTCNGPAYLYAALAQAMVQYASLYSNLPNATNVNGVWTWTITEDGLSVTLTSRKLSDGRYEWRMVLNGTDGSTTYSNWTAYVATTSADGKSGTATFYDDSPTPSTTADVIITWSTGANNVVTIEFESVSDLMKFILVSNGTTGEVTTYHKVGNAWVADGFHATWTSPGAVATC